MQPVRTGSSRLVAMRQVLMVCLLSAAASLSPSLAGVATASETSVGGVLPGSATWTLAGSPYVVTSTVQIAAGRTLTIEPGVEVRSAVNAPMFQLHGTIAANGTAEKPIVFDGRGSDFFTGKGATNAHLELSHVEARNGGALWPPTGYEQNAKFLIRDSYIHDNQGYNYIWYPLAGSTFQRNVFTNTGGFSVGSQYDVTFSNNHFIGPSRSGYWVRQWAAYGSPTAVHGNTFALMAGTALELEDGYSSAKLEAAGNYWLTEDAQSIAAMILDSNDSISRAGVVPFTPVLSSPAPETPVTRPTVPRGLSASAGDGTVSLTWPAPSYDGGAPISGYTVTSTTDGVLCTTSDRQCQVTGLTNGTPYVFTVVATNAAGSSEPSASASATPRTVPGQATGVVAVPGDRAALVTWNAPAFDGGSAITGYTVTANPGGASCSTTSTSCTVSGLTNGMAYTFTVVATNVAGSSATSESATSTPRTVAGQPTDVSAVPAPASAAISWAAPVSDGGSSITGYTATAIPGGATCSTTGTSCVVKGLTNGTSYTLTVLATNAAGNSAPSVAVNATPRTVPDPPTQVFGEASDASAQISWTEPLSDGGSPITGYTVTASPGGASCTTGALSCLISGLTNGTAYTFTVVATNAAGAGSASSASTPVTPAVPDTTAPTVALSGLPTYSLLPSLTLVYGGADAGSGMASYDVRYRRANFNAGFGALTYPSAWQATTARSVSVPAIKGATFCFSARSRDKAGNTSGWSPEKCVASVLDDRALAPSAGWTKPSSSAYYASTATTIAKTGATLTRPSVQTRKIAVVATRCRGCGVLGVYWNGRLIKQVSLNSTTTTHRTVFTVADFGTVKSGTLVLKTLNTGRTYVDGVGLSRS